MLEVASISKRYGQVQALTDISLTFKPGEIHAVVGENGAGKSTLMNIMSGFTKPDQGRLLLDGREIEGGHARMFKEAGIEMIHQHFTLVPNFTVAENLALSALDGLFAWCDVNKLAQPMLELASSLKWSFDSKALVRDLPVGVQQRLEILKALTTRARTIILDEPTAVLTADETEDLFRVLRSLEASGSTVVLIAHKLDEVFRIAKQVSVLRGGRLVGSVSIADTNPRLLAEMMIGELPDLKREAGRPPNGTALSIKDFVILGDRKEVSVDRIALDVKWGEILGIGGVDGNGQVELAEALARVRPILSGTLHTSTERIGYVPQDRQVDGLALGMTIQDNMVITGQRESRFSAGPFLRLSALRQWAVDLIASYEIRALGPQVLAGNLSGGNQQKVVLARVLDNRPDVIVVVNPTRGLDFRAAAFVQQQLLKAKERGAAVVLFSTDRDELSALSDRTLYLSRGRLYSEAGAALAGAPP